MVAQWLFCMIFVSHLFAIRGYLKAMYDADSGILRITNGTGFYVIIVEICGVAA